LKFRAFRDHRLVRSVFFALCLELVLAFPRAQALDLYPVSQVGSSQNAADRNRNASNSANRLGQNSIGRGNTNISHGHHHGAAGQPQVALGAFQVAQGILGLLAAMKASDLAGQNSDNADRLGSLSGNSPLASNGIAGPDGEAPSGITAQLGIGGASEAYATGKSDGASRTLASSAGAAPAATGLSPSALHSGELGSALAGIQDQYGISPEQFAGALANGMDPRTILMNAPKNPLSAEQAKKAYAAALASEGLDPGKAAAADAALLAENGAGEGVIDGNASGRSAEIPVGAEGSATAEASAASNGLRDRLARDLAGMDGESEEMAGLSPEVRAALAAREKQRRRDQVQELSLFEVVHLKYLEKQKSLFGTLGKIQGVGNSDGY
jgi:hypothetical protein